MHFNYAALQVDETDLPELLARMGADQWELVCVWQDHFILNAKQSLGHKLWNLIS
jgi:hypothetical protein